MQSADVTVQKETSKLMVKSIEATQGAQFDNSSIAKTLNYAQRASKVFPHADQQSVPA